jgi:inositol phosphorylceramide mannosyltransferase catalytic subunit
MPVPSAADNGIPPRIIQTGKQRQLSLKQRAFATNVQLLNPGYETCFFDNQDVERFIDREFPQHRRTFDSFTIPIQRYDFFRYLAVYRLGGFYLDLDVLLAAGLSDLRSAGCVFPFEGLTFSRWLRDAGMDWEIGNYAFGATAGHPFLEAAIENCVRAQRDPSWVRPMMQGVPALSRLDHYVLYTTGPGLLSRTLAENPAIASTVTVLFPKDVYEPRSWNQFGDIGTHIMEGTWRPMKSVFRRRVQQRWEAWRLKRLIREIKSRGTVQSTHVIRPSRGIE